MPDYYDLGTCRGPVTTAMMRSTPSVAHGAPGNVKTAEWQVVRFEQALESVPEIRYVFNNKCVDILATAREMMPDELAGTVG